MYIIGYVHYASEYSNAKFTAGGHKIEFFESGDYVLFNETKIRLAIQNDMDYRIARIAFNPLESMDLLSYYNGQRVVKIKYIKGSVNRVLTLTI